MSSKKVISIGSLKVGAGNPISVQSMIKSSLEDKKAVSKEIKLLEEFGCEIVRVAVENQEYAKAISFIKKKTEIPLEADIHFDYRLALAAMDNGVDAVRINPQNMVKRKDVLSVVKEAKNRKIPIRLGINSGGFRGNFSEKVLAGKMFSKISDYIKILEDARFYDIILSLKTSSINSTVLVNRLVSEKFPYPLHLGVTATGPREEGIIKSSIGLGILLSENIGDTLRVSLNSPSWEEVRIGRIILQSLGKRRFGPEIISCPTCSRCKVDLRAMVESFKKSIAKTKLADKSIDVAIMGCVVNGPGEASQADCGIAFGRKKAVFFKKGAIQKSLPAKDSLKFLLGFLKGEDNG